MKTVLFSLALWIFKCTDLSAQTLVADETHALLHVLVTDFSDDPLNSETVILKGKTNGKKFSGTTKEDGTFDVLLPKGDTYIITYLSFIDEKEYSEMEIPAGKGILEGQLRVQMETEKSEIYEMDIHFESSKAVIQPESFSQLDRLASQMKAKPTITIELSGHTDSDGEEAANLTLSKLRATEVKNYLVKKGISTARISTAGFGETKPVADNSTIEGKAKNRRTEVRVTKW